MKDICRVCNVQNTNTCMQPGLIFSNSAHIACPHDAPNSQTFSTCSPALHHPTSAGHPQANVCMQTALHPADPVPLRRETTLPRREALPEPQTLLLQPEEAPLHQCRRSCGVLLRVFPSWRLCGVYGAASAEGAPRRGGIER